MKRDITAWVSFGVAVAIVVAIVIHDPMVIVLGFAGLGLGVFLFAVWMLWRLFRRPSPKASDGRAGKGGR